MRTGNPGKYLVWQHRAVIRAKQRGAGEGRHGEVEQVLVTLALIDLSGRAARPNRFTDPARVSTGSSAEEVAPKGNDPRRVAPNLLDRNETHPFREGAELGL